MQNKIPEADSLVSKLVMGFVERRISSHTIADIVTDQIKEHQMDPHTLAEPTISGVLEVLCSRLEGSEIYELISFFSNHSKFPTFLSLKGLLGCLTAVLRFLDSGHIRKSRHSSDNIMVVLELLINEGLKRFSRGEVTPIDGIKLFSTMKSPVLMSHPLLLKNAAYQSFKKVLEKFSLGQQKNQLYVPSFLSPKELIQSFLAAPVEELVEQGPAHFKLSPDLEKSGWKVKNLTVLLELFARPDVSAPRKGFLTHWFWTGALLYATRQVGMDSQLLQQLAKSILETKEIELDVLKGIFLAVQDDYSQICLSEGKNPFGPDVIPGEALRHGQSLFYLLISLTQKHPTLLSRQFVPWALGLSVDPQESRLLTRNQWQWVRSLASGIWEEDLKQAPEWVLQAASKLSAQIFQMAPGAWISDFSYLFFQRLWVESQGQNFVSTQGHLDYVEFLVRSARRKSPVFCSHPESLLSLKILGRLKTAEEQHLRLIETRNKLSKIQNWGTLVPASSFSQNMNFKDPELVELSMENMNMPPATRALGLLTYLAKSISKVASTLDISSQGPLQVKLGSLKPTTLKIS